MASDNLKQIGNYMRETREGVDFVLDRKLPFRISVERIRDIFNDEVPVEMDFRTKSDEQRVRMDIRFMKPPSSSVTQPPSGGIAGYCQTFTIGTANEILQLNNPYEPGSVSVFMNGSVLSSANWYEYNYSAGQVFVEGGDHTINTVDICYDLGDGVGNNGSGGGEDPEEPVCQEITDAFNRTETEGWGTSDAGLDWTFNGAETNSSVDGSRATMAVSGNRFAYLDINSAHSEFTITAQLDSTSASHLFFLAFQNSNGDNVEVDMWGDGDVMLATSSASDTDTVAFTATTEFKIMIDVTGTTTIDAYVWDASTSQPGSPTLTITDGTADFTTDIVQLFVGGSGGTFNLWVDDLDVEGLSGCGSVPEPPVYTGGSWFGYDNPWAGLPFCGSMFTEAPAGQMWISGDQGGRIIEFLKFTNRTAGVNVIVLDNVSNLTIRYIDFDTVPEGIYINGGSNIDIGYLRMRNNFGPFTRTAFHSGNLIQAADPGPMHFHDMKVYQPSVVPAGYGADWGTEDILSIGGSTLGWGGTSWDDPLLIERFAFYGGDYQSVTGTGAFIGDGDLIGSGQYVWVRDGILVDPGEVGIGTGENGPYKFERLKITHNAGNNAIQLRSDIASFGNVLLDWPGLAFNSDGHSYTDLGGNNFSASLDRASMLDQCIL